MRTKLGKNGQPRPIRRREPLGSLRGETRSLKSGFLFYGVPLGVLRGLPEAFGVLPSDIMVALRTRFDGQRIEVPAELRGVAPGDVLIVYLADEKQPEPVQATRPSIWDAVNQGENGRSAADIHAQVRADRDSWGDR